MKEKKIQEEKKQSHARFVLRIFLLSLALSAILSLFSSVAMEGAGLGSAVIVLLFFILLGIVFDIIGVAVTAADPKPFHSMASHRTKGARAALRLIANADRAASFCNDVVGDICGIVSGSTAAVIVVHLQRSFTLQSVMLSTAVTALISGLTIGGKAVGKQIAMKQSKKVVFFVGRVLAGLHFEKQRKPS